MPDEQQHEGAAADNAAVATTTKSGLRLRIRRLTSQEAAQYQWIALLPYSWTNDKTARQIAYSWPVLAASATAVGLAAAGWKLWGGSNWRLKRWPGLLLCCCLSLTPEATRRLLQLLLWLFSTRRLPDYFCFAEFWGAEHNRLFGAFVDAADDDDDARHGPGGSAEQIVGTVASLHVDDATCEMQRLGVPERWRGCGIGDALCRHLLANSTARGYRWMRLVTSRLQAPAVRLYESLGFARVSQCRYSLSLSMPGNPAYTYTIDLVQAAAAATAAAEKGKLGP